MFEPQMRRLSLGLVKNNLRICGQCIIEYKFY
jgi:hypothetical protein